MQSDEYTTSRNTAKYIGVHPNTLRSWDKKKLIDTIRTPSGQRLYNISKFKRTRDKHDEGKKEKRFDAIYCRVSSHKQAEDLKRQTRRLEASYKGFQVFSDTGSGINFKRKGFKRLLQQVMRGNVRKIVVSYKDRLCRIAFDLLEWICHQHQTELLVHNSDKDGSDEKELLEDLMAIVHVFSSILYGKRSNINRKSNPVGLEKQDGTGPHDGPIENTRDTS